MAQVIVVGGGLSGLSSVHTVLEHGGRAVLIDKNAFLGGNSTKATSGINGALTRAQVKLGIPDSVDQFLADTAKSALGTGNNGPAEATPHAKVLVYNSGPGVEWLTDKFGLDLSLVSRLGGHTHPRTHRGKEKFPGMTITYALMEKYEDICKNEPHRARLITEAKVTELIVNNNEVVGVKYEKDGKTYEEHGPVVIATGGYGADFTDSGLLKQYRPDLLPHPTTNGDHCTGDGIKMGAAIGANLVDMNQVQVHPTGLVHPKDPDAKVKFLAAEALRGVGGLMFDKDGHRFVNELGTRDYVSGVMFKVNKPPYRLVLNSASGREIEWHCKHYQGRGLMKHFANGAEMAKDMGVSVETLKKTMDEYNNYAKNNNDPFGRKFFQNLPWKMDDSFWVAVICPVVHYCMGGLQITPAAECLDKTGKVIKGLFACGEVTGGVHGNNRLGGSSLLDCVVYGRVSGDTAARYLFDKALSTVSDPSKRLGAIVGHLAPGVHVHVAPNSNKVSVEIVGSGDSHGHATPAPAPKAGGAVPSTKPPGGDPWAKDPIQKPADAAPAAAAGGNKVYTLEEVAKHNTEKDCWVAVNGQVLDVTKFMHKHPGGKPALMLYAGKDATEEFNMLHKPDVVAKYAPETVIGTLAGGAGKH